MRALEKLCLRAPESLTWHCILQLNTEGRTANEISVIEQLAYRN